MSETTSTETAPAEQTTETPPEGTEAKTFDAEYVEKLRKESAKYRTEAKANADAAKRLAEIEEANKTAEQKATERLAEIEARAVALAAKEARTDVSAETGVPANILAGPEDSTPEAIKAFADAVIAYAEQVSKPRAPKPDPNQGRAPGGLPLDPRAADLAQIEHDLKAGSRR